MKTYWNINGTLNTIKEWQPNCWIQVTCPTEQEQQELEETYNIPDYFISDISDTDERARYEYDDGSDEDRDSHDGIAIAEEGHHPHNEDAGGGQVGAAHPHEP